MIEERLKGSIRGHFAVWLFVWEDGGGGLGMAFGVDGSGDVKKGLAWPARTANPRPSTCAEVPM